MPRIVIDEFHQLLISHDFRPHLYNLRTLLEFPTPKILLTATLPPTLQNTALEMLGMKPDSPNLKIIRATTNRPEHRYICLPIVAPYESKIIAAFMICQLHHRFFTKKSRGLVFCTSIEQSEALGSILESRICNSARLNRKEELEAWHQGVSRGDQWMTATSCLTHGIDEPNVEAVVFFDLPHNLFELVQGAARGGRLGQSCTILVLQFAPHEKPVGKDYQLRKTLNLWSVDYKTCRRALLSSAMDGKKVTCDTLPGAIGCNICDPRSMHNTLIKESLAIRPVAISIDDYMLSMDAGTAPPSSPTSYAYQVYASCQPFDQRDPSPSLENNDFGISDGALLAIDMKQFNKTVSKDPISQSYLSDLV